MIVTKDEKLKKFVPEISVAQDSAQKNIAYKAYYYMCYEPLVEFLCSIDEAAIVQRMHYWLQKEDVGYLLADGCKWIYNGYREWLEQFPHLTQNQFGRMMRHLEEIGWVTSAKFYQLEREVGFVGRAPQMHVHNQRKWYKLNYQIIYEDTGFDLLGLEPPPKSPKSKKTLKPARLSNVQKCTMQSADLHNASCDFAHSSIYKEIPLSNQSDECINKYNNPEQQDDEFDPWAEPPQDTPRAEEVKEEPGFEDQDSHEVQSSAAPGQGFAKMPQKRPEGAAEQEIWEIAPDRPYPVFLNWWADHKYKPQGGHWAADAYGNAYAEFYNNRNKTTAAIFPQFLEYMQQVAENTDASLANGIKAILPSCFVLRPESTQENVQQLMVNIENLIDRGAQVALPNQQPTPSCTQSMSFDSATGAREIKALPNLQPPALEPATDMGEHEQLLRSLYEQQAIWKNEPMRRGLVREWARRTPGIVMTLDGPTLDPTMVSLPAAL